MPTQQIERRFRRFETTYYLPQYDHRQRLARARKIIPLQVAAPLPLVRPSLLWGGAVGILVAFPVSSVLAFLAFVWVSL